MMRRMVMFLAVMWLATACGTVPPGADDGVAALGPTPTAVPTGQLPAPTPDPSQVTVKLEPVIDGLDEPTFVTHAADGSGRLFALEKGGKIRIFADGQLLAEPFLDLTGQVSGSSEQGLLGLAFAPDYVTSGHFYVNYTDENGDTIVARYRVSDDDPDRADPSSRSVILKVDQPAANHNGGMLAFGPDGYLYVGMGDGGGARDQYKNGQNPQTLLGKVLRLDVASAGAQAYTVPPDNPWVANDWNGQDVRDEIWAVGLRNPWRFSFDRETGDLWIGDVGQGDREEIDYVSAGSRGGINFGWPIMEGATCLDGDTCDQAGLTPPITDYTHEGNCSVTGGYVYRGRQIPAWHGLYFYGDYCSGKIWTLTADGHGGRTTAEVVDTDLTITSFGEDEAGELYVVDYARGNVYRMVDG